MKKYVGVLLIGVVCLLCGCSPKSKIADSTQCLVDFVQLQKGGTMSVIGLLDYDEDSIVINKRQTNEDKKEDIVHCSITGSNDYAIHNYECILYYNYYDEGDWILDDVEITDQSIELTKGREQDDVLEEMNGRGWMYIPGSYDNLGDFEIAEDSFDSESLLYFATIHFQAKREPNTIGFNVAGDYYYQARYNENTGEWEGIPSVYNLTSQELLGFEGVWDPRSKGSSTHTFIRDDNNVYRCVDNGYQSVDGEDLSPLINMNLLQSYFEIDLPTATWEVQIDWDSSTLSVYYNKFAGTGIWHKQ